MANEAIISMNSIRQSSIAFATALGYQTNPLLPVFDDGRVVRSVSEIVDRIFTLHCVAAAAFGFDRRKAMSWLDSEAGTRFLTEDEERFLQSGIGDRQALANQVEGILALAWAVSLGGDLDFALPCPNDFVLQLPDLKMGENGKNFRSNAKLRSSAEIVGATDLAYCLHWSIQDAQLKDKKMPGKVEAYVIIERRRALEWLLTDDSWEDISLDT